MTTDKDVMAPRGPLFPDVTVTLVGKDGNVFALAGIVSRGLKNKGHYGGSDQMLADLTKCQSYDEALALFMRTVNVR